MGFSESVKDSVRAKSNHTCCWCNERKYPTDVHHIVPQDEDGDDTEDNAALLCKNCHGTYGGNPELRKEIRRRRDTWYERVALFNSLPLEASMPFDDDVPLLDYTHEAEPKPSLPRAGIAFSDRSKDDHTRPPSFYLSVYFKPSRYFTDYTQINEKWLYLEGYVRHVFSLRIQVRAFNDRDVIALINVMRFGYTDRTRSGHFMGGQGWNLQGFRPTPDQSPDNFYLWNENNQTRLLLSTFSPTHAAISIHARLSEKTRLAFVEYLESTDFVKGI